MAAFTGYDVFSYHLEGIKNNNDGHQGFYSLKGHRFIGM